MLQGVATLPTAPWRSASVDSALRARPAENFRLVAAEALSELERFLEMSFSAAKFLIID